MNLRTPLQGMLFDFDGIILDTEMPIYQAWKQKFKEYGGQLQLDQWADILGKSSHALDQILDLLEPLQNPEKRKAFLQEASELESEGVMRQEPLPGAVDLIHKANRAGLCLGIVSSSDRDWVQSHLDRLGLLDYFDHISCVEEVLRAKPDPALYELGMTKMGASSDRVVVVEDSPNGVLAAKRAGLFCIAVPNELTRRLPYHENGGEPDLVLSSLEEFPWDELMRENP